MNQVKKIKVMPNSVNIDSNCFKKDIENNSETFIAGYYDEKQKKFIKDSVDLKEKTLLFAKFKTDNCGVFVSTYPIYINKIKYITALPDLSQVYLSASIDNFNLSEKYKFEKFPICGDKLSSDNVSILDFDEDNSHPCYVEYIKCKVTSIIMLAAALEAFINSQIPETFIFNYHKDGNIYKQNKKEIERFVDMTTKLKFLIPELIGKKTYWQEVASLKKSFNADFILECYDIRNELIHLKFISDKNINLKYNLILKSLVNFKIENGINMVILFINDIIPGSINYYEPSQLPL